MKIMVTGSEGSLAQMVIPKLMEQGHEVFGYDNFARYGTIDRKRQYAFDQTDLTDSEAVRSIFKKNEFDVVFHFAALVYGVIGFHKCPGDIIVDNNLMTANLLKYGSDKIGRIVYLSSSMVYERCTSFPHKEEDADSTIVMSTSYGLSKYISERIIQSYNEQYGIKYVIWRPFNIITPFETPEEEGFSHVFSDLTEKIIVQKQNPLAILGDGQQIRCFTNIYDVADAAAAFSLDPKAENQVFNIGNPEPVTVKQLAERIAKVGKKYGLLPENYSLSFLSKPVYADDVKKRIPDVTKMEKVFGWKAGIKLDESLEMYIKHKIEV